MTPRRLTGPAGLLAAIAIAALSTGCARLGITAPAASSVTIASVSNDAGVAYKADRAVFARGEDAIVDLYLTDLTLAQVNALLEGASTQGVNGYITHIHMFLWPKAGRTPIDFDASNATISHFVVADGRVGIYGGGGFVLPSSGREDSSFAARVSRATLRLVGAAPGFLDRLDGSTMTASLRAKPDPDAVRLLSRFAASANRTLVTPLTEDDLLN